jgi:hypothetical protein
LFLNSSPQMKNVNTIGTNSIKVSSPQMSDPFHWLGHYNWTQWPW